MQNGGIEVAPRGDGPSLLKYITYNITYINRDFKPKAGGKKGYNIIIVLYLADIKAQAH
jgi:hypothetical protein